MSKTQPPVSGKSLPIVPLPQSYDAALYYELFCMMEEVSETSPNILLEKTRLAVMGNSVEHSTWMMGFMSKLIITCSQSCDLIQRSQRFYLELSEGKEVSPC